MDPRYRNLCTKYVTHLTIIYFYNCENSSKSLSNITKAGEVADTACLAKASQTKFSSLGIHLAEYSLSPILSYTSYVQLYKNISLGRYLLSNNPITYELSPSIQNWPLLKVEQMREAKVGPRTSVRYASLVLVGRAKEAKGVGECKYPKVTPIPAPCLEKEPSNLIRKRCRLCGVLRGTHVTILR